MPRVHGYATTATIGYYASYFATTNFGSIGKTVMQVTFMIAIIIIANSQNSYYLRTRAASYLAGGMYGMYNATGSLIGRENSSSNDEHTDTITILPH